MTNTTACNPPFTEGILAAVRANIAKLDACGNHEFEFSPELSKPLRTQFTCKVCGGVIDGQKARWYHLGRIHQAKLIHNPPHQPVKEL